jgi:hypothetical protein
LASHRAGQITDWLIELNHELDGRVVSCAEAHMVSVLRYAVHCLEDGDDADFDELAALLRQGSLISTMAGISTSTTPGTR